MFIEKPKILKQISNFCIIFNGLPIQCVPSIKILGVIIDDKLEWTTQINYVSKRCNNIITSLYPLKNVLKCASKIIIINAYVLSIINYASVVWLNSSKNNCKIIDKLLKRSGRFIYRKRYIDTITKQICVDLKWLTSSFKYQFEVLKIAFSIMHGTAPDYFVNYLNFNNFTQRTTRNECKNYMIASHENSLSSFRSNATKLWLDLPDRFKDVTLSLNKFKYHIFTTLLSKQTAELVTQENNMMYQTCIDNAIAMYL